MRLVSTKERAIKYRNQGYSYRMISEKLGLSKSTLRGCLKSYPLDANLRVMI